MTKNTKTHGARFPLAPLARTDLYARYTPSRGASAYTDLPIVALDPSGQPLVLTRDARLIHARKARPDGGTFAEVVTR